MFLCPKFFPWLIDVRLIMPTHNTGSHGCVIILCAAVGMKFYRYSPTASEISISEKGGAVTSAMHPLLGRFLCYTPRVSRYRMRAWKKRGCAHG